MNRITTFFRQYPRKFKYALNKLLPRAFLYGSLGVPALLLALFILLLTTLTKEGLFEDKVQQFANLLESSDDFYAREWRFPPRADEGATITIIEIDDSTLNWLGKKIETRDFIHCLVRRLADMQPRAIGLDYLFSSAYDFANESGTVRCPDGREIDIKPFDELDVPVIVAGQRIRNPVTGQWRMIEPGPTILTEDSQSRGYMGFSELTQSILINKAVRAQALVSLDEGGALGSFSLALAAMGEGTIGPEYPWRKYLKDKQAALLGEPEKLNHLNESMLRYQKPNLLFDSLSAYSVFFSKVPEPVWFGMLEKRFRGDYILIGNTAAQTQDYFEHPLSTVWPLMPKFFKEGNTKESFPGVYIHAYTVWNILSDSFLTVDSEWSPLSQIFVLLGPIVLYFLLGTLFSVLPLTGRMKVLVFAILTAAAVAFSNWQLLQYYNVASAMAMPGISILVGSIILGGVFYLYPVALTVLAILFASFSFLFHHAAEVLIDDQRQLIISNQIIWGLIAYLLATLGYAMWQIMRESSMADMLKRHNSNKYFYENPVSLEERVTPENLLKPFTGAVGYCLNLGDVFVGIGAEDHWISRELATLQSDFEVSLHRSMEDFCRTDDGRGIGKNDYLLMIDNYGQNCLNAYILPVGVGMDERWAGGETNDGDKTTEGVAARLVKHLQADKHLEFNIRNTRNAEGHSVCGKKVMTGTLQIIDIPSRVESGVLTACGELIDGLHESKQKKAEAKPPAE